MRVGSVRSPLPLRSTQVLAADRVCADDETVRTHRHTRVSGLAILLMLIHWPAVTLSLEPNDGTVLGSVSEMLGDLITVNAMLSKLGLVPQNVLHPSSRVALFQPSVSGGWGYSGNMTVEGPSVDRLMLVDLVSSGFDGIDGVLIRVRRGAVDTFTRRR